MTSPVTVPRAADLAPMAVDSRLSRLRPLLEGTGSDSLLVTTLPNIRYLTGFTGSAALLFVTGEETLLVTDGRYRTQAAEQLQSAGLATSVELVIGGVPVQRDAIVSVASRGGGRVGLEAENVTWGSQRRWAEALPGVELVATAGLVEQLRLVKDAGEVARMATAASIADAALGEILGLLGQGRTEVEVGLALDTAMRRLGSEDRAFETIVASGPNAAKPHARPTDRRIAAGDPVVIDFGATFDGYRSDMTRTFCVGGQPGPELARVFAVVAEAQAAGVAGVAAGVASGDIDKICRDRIALSGWAEAFEHGTGHGVGLDTSRPASWSPSSRAFISPAWAASVSRTPSW
jgi:Xaa-Pro aminopeptidase